MSHFVIEHDYVVVLPRPESVVEWADIEGWLCERAERLLPLLTPPDHVARADLGEAWTILDPEYDLGRMCVVLERPLRLSERTDETAYLRVMLAVAGTSAPTPPAELALEVGVAQELEVAKPESLRDRVELGVVMGGAALAAVAAFWLVTRADHGLGLAVTAAIFAFIGGLIGLIVLMQRLPNRARAELAAREPGPSQALGALLAAVATQYPPPAST
jgi:hypothetical protein